jgi:peroxiredoxin
MSKRLHDGSMIEQWTLGSIRSTTVRIPEPDGIVHLQFRRFAGCPICDLHLSSFARRYEELVAASIREVVVFHSSAKELRGYCASLPFDTIADPEKELYRHFGVESGLRALLDPAVWIPIGRGVLRSLARTLSKHGPLPPVNPQGGRFGLPADFLISPDGVVFACKYGSHAYDQWSVDEVLNLCRSPKVECELAGPG